MEAYFIIYSFVIDVFLFINKINNSNGQRQYNVYSFIIGKHAIHLYIER
jgi:hypothetical protein